MARFTKEGIDTNAIYQAAAAFRDRCLLQDGSLLFDGAAVWTPDNLARFHGKFVGGYDASDSTFTEKLKGQLKDQEQSVKRLAAEMLAVYFLFPINVTARRKRQLVGEVLSWGGDTVPEEHPVWRAFEGGLGGGGQGYNTRRYYELAFLLNFAIAWKHLKSDEARQTMQDPWLLQDFFDGVDETRVSQLRHILLHMLFPDHFESITSGSHKKQVDRAFSGLLKEAPDGLDRRLLAIRKELERLLPGQALDFFRPPLADAWWGSSDDLDVIHHKKQVVLYGPPGTSKTYRAWQFAEQIIRSAALQRWGGGRYFREQEKVRQAVRDNIHFKQLHPAFSYEDFIQGIHMSGGSTEYRPGILLQILGRMKGPPEERLPHVLILDEMNRTDLSRMLGECFSLLENRDRPVKLPGKNEEGQEMTLLLPPDLYVIGTMNLIDQSVEQIDFALRRRFLWIECPFEPDVLFDVLQKKWAARPSSLSRHGWDRVEDDFRRLVAAATALKQAINESKLLGPQYEVGHTYFFDVVLFLQNELIDKTLGHKFYLYQKGKPRDNGAVQRLWKLSLEPLLKEYLSGLREDERKGELDRLKNAFYSPPEAEE
jgi:5-methylcytosine-specific restriction protein B